MKNEKEFVERIRLWRENPVQFVRDVFNAEPDEWQKDFLMAFPNNERLALKACKGPGKTCVLSWAAWNFLATRPHPKIAATSITKDNLDDGLWTEMAKWMNKSNFLRENFVWQKTRIAYKNNPETWYMSARNWSKSSDSQQQSETLAGLHADYILFLIDEAGGVPDSIMAAVEAGLSTGIETKIMIAGNPTQLSGPLYRACNQERHLWHIQEITGDPDDPKRSPRIKVDWAKSQIEKYGRHNNWVLVNVFGKFPSASLNTLISHEEVVDAMNRGLQEHEYNWSQKRIGVDVARFGDDSTVLFPRQGLCAFPPTQMRNERTNTIGDIVIGAKLKWGSEMEFIDDTGGFGAGVVDHMLTSGYSPTPINFSSKALDPAYYNLRSEMYFKLADWIKRGGALPNVPELTAELTSPTYTFDKGKLRVQGKDQIKESLGRSPDFADALALTFALPDQPKTTVEDLIFNRTGSIEKAKTDYDPLETL